MAQFEDACVAAELDGDDDESDQDHDVEHEILDNGDDGGSAETAGVGVGGEDDEATARGHSPWRPIALMTTRMPTSWSAM